MKAVKTILAGGAAMAALASAAPVSAQYFPGYGYGSGDIFGSVIGSVITGGYGSPYGSRYGSGYGMPYGGSYGSPYAYGSYGSPYGYGAYGSPYGYGGGYGAPYAGRPMAGNSQYAVGQCMGAVQQRLNSTYPAGQGSARVLGVSDVQPRNQGGMLVSGVANSGRTASVGYNGQAPVDLTFTCKTDASGTVSSIEVGQAASVNPPTYGAPVASPYGNDYSAYGYRRY